jgi:hypothetical protein
MQIRQVRDAYGWDQQVKQKKKEHLEKNLSDHFPSDDCSTLKASRVYFNCWKSDVQTKREIHIRERLHAITISKESFDVHEVNLKELEGLSFIFVFSLFNPS